MISAGTMNSQTEFLPGGESQALQLQFWTLANICHHRLRRLTNTLTDEDHSSEAKELDKSETVFYISLQKGTSMKGPIF